VADGGEEQKRATAQTKVVRLPVLWDSRGWLPLIAAIRRHQRPACLPSRPPERSRRHHLLPSIDRWRARAGRRPESNDNGFYRHIFPEVARALRPVAESWARWPLSADSVEKV